MLQKIRYKFKDYDEISAKLISDSLSTSVAVGRLLNIRGCHTARQASAFLNPKLDYKHDPALLPDITESADLVKSVVDSKGKIAIFGDYDVDGVLGSTILKSFFDLVGADSIIEIPNRFKDGYGLNSKTVETLISKGAKLIICVDNGTTAISAIKVARENGVKVIVVDHHEELDNLPDALIVNPKRYNSNYPFRELCSTAISYKFAEFLADYFRKDMNKFSEFFVDNLGLVAIATIADVVPLTGENRILVNWGLKTLENTKIYGLKRSLEELEIKEIKPFELAFKLIPFFNSFGRMHEALNVYTILTSKDHSVVSDTIQKGKELNKLRKAEDTRVLAAALEQVDQSKQVTVVWNDGWHEGVLGIVAAKLVEKFGKPAFVLTKKGDSYKGSTRSIKGIDITKVMGACHDSLLKYGGHKMAGGLELKAENLPLFLEKLYSLDVQREDQYLELDSVIDIDEVHISFAKTVKLLGPFGYMNPEPVFMVKDVNLLNETRIGKNSNHTSFIVSKNRINVRAISFNQVFESISPKAKYDIVCTVLLNNYLGTERAELQISHVIDPRA